MPKESIISISKPMPKAQPQQDESEIQSSSTLGLEIAITEELEQPDLESVKPAAMQFTTTYHSGWKASDILREIRLDNFEMGGAD